MDRHTNLDFLGRDPNDVADESRSLLQLDDRHDIRQQRLKCRMVGTMVHGKTENPATSRGFNPRRIAGPTGGAHNRCWQPAMPAARTLLKAENTSCTGIPERAGNGVKSGDWPVRVSHFSFVSESTMRGCSCRGRGH